jgi:hypothetical protein
MLGFDLPARRTNSLAGGSNPQNFFGRKTLKVFEGQTRKLKVGREAEDFPMDDNLSLADLKGHPIFLVFWKTL